MKSTVFASVVWMAASLVLSNTALGETPGNWVPMESRRICNTTVAAFSMLKAGQYEPLLTSRVNDVILTVWLSEKKEVMVTNTINVSGTTNSLTCIVAVGDQQTWVNVDAVLPPSSEH